MLNTSIKLPVSSQTRSADDELHPQGLIIGGDHSAPSYDINLRFRTFTFSNSTKPTLHSNIVFSVSFFYFSFNLEVKPKLIQINYKIKEIDVQYFFKKVLLLCLEKNEFCDWVDFLNCWFPFCTSIVRGISFCIEN